MTTVTRDMLEEAVLNFSQRKKRAQTLRRFASKIQIARKRALLKLATSESIEARARRAAVKIVRKIVAGKLGMEYDQLSIGQKMEIDKKVQLKSRAIAKIARRLIPKIRKKELERFRAINPMMEAAGAGEEGTDELVNNYVDETPYQDSPFLPGMVLNKQYYFDRYGHNAQAVMDAVTMKTSQRAKRIDDC